MAREHETKGRTVNEQSRQALEKAGVPLISLADACASCPDNEAADYPRAFDVDMDTEMLGSCKEYGRQIVISSNGKKDWIREVTDDKTKLAGLVYDTYSDALAGLDKPSQNGSAGADLSSNGIYPSLAQKSEQAPSSRLSVVTSSFYSSADDDEAQSVIVLPDYKIVRHVPESKEGASQFVQDYLLPDVSRTGKPTAGLKSWQVWACEDHAQQLISLQLLNCRAYVPLAGSHKKRDQRCSIAAPLLFEELYHHLQQNDIEVDVRGDDLAEGPAIEDWPQQDRERRFDEAIQGVKKAGSRRVGIFSISHIGGHRVRPVDIAAIVEHTILGGKVIPELLRGGLGLACHPNGLLAW